MRRTLPYLAFVLALAASIPAAAAAPAKSDLDRAQALQRQGDCAAAIQGGWLLLWGSFEDGKMVLRSRAGESPLNRVSWTPLEDGRVRQLWEASEDGGKTWSVTFDGIYTRSEKPEGPPSPASSPTPAAGSGARRHASG